MSTKKSKAAAPRNAPIDSEAFVVAWQKAKNMDEVVKSTGMSRSSAAGRATRLRKKGVPLQAFGSSKKLDIPALTKIAKEAKPAAK